MPTMVDDAPTAWVAMELKGLILDPANGSPVVILREEGGNVFLPIWIGACEANAIAMAVEGVEVPRPMTHDLLGSAIDALGGEVERIEIHDLREGTFYARLIVRTGSGPLEIDSRPSDAIALAVRVGATIRATRTVLDAALASSRAAETSDEERLRQWLAEAKPEDLGEYEM